MTTKPSALLPIAVAIYRVRGEEDVRLWYDSLSEEQMLQVQNELATSIEIVNNSFREIGEIFQRQSDAMISAFRSFSDAIENIGKIDTTRLV